MLKYIVNSNVHNGGQSCFFVYLATTELFSEILHQIQLIFSSFTFVRLEKGKNTT
jgi:hypothetical protein